MSQISRSNESKVARVQDWDENADPVGTPPDDEERGRHETVAGPKWVCHECLEGANGDEKKEVTNEWPDRWQTPDCDECAHAKCDDCKLEREFWGEASPTKERANLSVASSMIERLNKAGEILRRGGSSYPDSDDSTLKRSARQKPKSRLPSSDAQPSPTHSARGASSKPPKSSSQLNAISLREDAHVDIILVQSLSRDGTQGRKAWTARNGVFWPETLLPRTLRECRPMRANVFTFGYDLAPGDPTPLSSLAKGLVADVGRRRVNDEDFPRSLRRPILWIAHGFGGILLKAGLRLASKYRDQPHSDDRHARFSVYLSTHSIVFFGTPFLGDGRASTWNSILRKMVDAGGGSTSDPSDLLAGLVSQAGNINNANRYFLDFAARFNIHTIGEGRERMFSSRKGTKWEFVVDEKTAKLDMPGVVSRTLPDSHENLVKYTSEKSAGYAIVERAVRNAWVTGERIIKDRWDIDAPGIAVSPVEAAERNRPTTPLPRGSYDSSRRSSASSFIEMFSKGSPSLRFPASARLSRPPSPSEESLPKTSDIEGPGGNTLGVHSLEEPMSDKYGSRSELKTNTGREGRQKTVVACVACRRKKIRCSAEKPACKHCLRSQIPCDYRVSVQKAAPAIDFREDDPRIMPARQATGSRRNADEAVIEIGGLKLLPKTDQLPRTGRAIPSDSLQNHRQARTQYAPRGMWKPVFESGKPRVGLESKPVEGAISSEAASWRPATGPDPNSKAEAELRKIQGASPIPFRNRDIAPGMTSSEGLGSDATTDLNISIFDRRDSMSSAIGVMSISPYRTKTSLAEPILHRDTEVDRPEGHGVDTKPSPPQDRAMPFAYPPPPPPQHQYGPMAGVSDPMPSMPLLPPLHQSNRAARFSIPSRPQSAMGLRSITAPAYPPRYHYDKYAAESIDRRGLSRRPSLTRQSRQDAEDRLRMPPPMRPAVSTSSKPKPSSGLLASFYPPVSVYGRTEYSGDSGYGSGPPVSTSTDPVPPAMIGFGRNPGFQTMPPPEESNQVKQGPSFNYRQLNHIQYEVPHFQPELLFAVSGEERPTRYHSRPRDGSQEQTSRVIGNPWQNTQHKPPPPRVLKDPGSPPPRSPVSTVRQERWTKINRKLVNPDALREGDERFEERDGFLIVLRVLSQEEIEKYAAATKRLRAARETGKGTPREESGSKEGSEDSQDPPALAGRLDVKENESTTTSNVSESEDLRQGEPSPAADSKDLPSHHVLESFSKKERLLSLSNPNQQPLTALTSPSVYVASPEFNEYGVSATQPSERPGDDRTGQKLGSPMTTEAGVLQQLGDPAERFEEDSRKDERETRPREEKERWEQELNERMSQELAPDTNPLPRDKSGRAVEVQIQRRRQKDCRRRLVERLQSAGFDDTQREDVLNGTPIRRYDAQEMDQGPREQLSLYQVPRESLRIFSLEFEDDKDHSGFVNLRHSITREERLALFSHKIYLDEIGALRRPETGQLTAPPSEENSDSEAPESVEQNVTTGKVMRRVSISKTRLKPFAAAEDSDMAAAKKRLQERFATTSSKPSGGSVPTATSTAPRRSSVSGERSTQSEMKVEAPPEASQTISISDALSEISQGLSDDLELVDIYPSGACWTCTPGESISTDIVPLLLKSPASKVDVALPVIIPVETSYPLRAPLDPPPDPCRQFINPTLYLPDSLIEEIFKVWDDVLGFYLLCNGWLQLIVPNDFEYEHALSHRPREFGKLKVSYILESMTPTAGISGATAGTAPSQTQPTEMNQGISTAPKEQTLTTVTTVAADALALTVGGTVQASVRGVKSKNRFEARAGVMTKCDGKSFVTVPTHLLTEALLDAKVPLRPGSLPLDKVDTVARSGGSQLGPVAMTFDPAARAFPNGFVHDITLIDVTKTSSITAARMRSPLPTSWLSQAGWQELKYNTSNLFLLGSTVPEELRQPKVKSIKLLESQCQAVGQGIFKLRQPPQRLFSSFRTNSNSTSKAEEADTWTQLVSRSLLFRVHPDARPTGPQSGMAVCTLEEKAVQVERPVGTYGSSTESIKRKVAKVAGFASFVQEVSAVQNFDMEGPRLYSRLEQGRVAFFGAFQVPKQLREEHIIVHERTSVV